MAKARKRFQTGREIMKAYVPDYAPPLVHFEDRQGLGARSGEEVARVLLGELTRRLSAKKLKLEHASEVPNKGDADGQR